MIFELNASREESGVGSSGVGSTLKRVKIGLKIGVKIVKISCLEVVLCTVECANVVGTPEIQFLEARCGSLTWDLCSSRRIA